MELRNTPWGFEELLWQDEALTVKILHVNPGHRFSLQLHHGRDEEWTVLSEACRAVISEETKEYKKGECLLIPRGTKHRLGGTTTETVVLEVCRGRFDQNDIVRFEDDYGRC